MKTTLFLASAAAMLLVAPAYAVDHNNLDEDRPLRFDDAESIAFRERSFEGGVRLDWPRGRPFGLGLDLEFLYGYALNSHLHVAARPVIGGRRGSRDTRLDLEDVSVGALVNFNREHNSTPAFSLRGDVTFPTGRGSRGADFRLRGIMSKARRQYDRLHLNVDLNVASNAPPGERTFRPGVILGYSTPLGYPRKFTRTAVAELAVEAGPESGKGPLVTLGFGVRQQVTVRSVFDVGIESDIASFQGAAADRLRLIAGYSVGY